MGMTAQMIEVPGQAPDHEQKRFAEFVSTYGEEAAARFAEGLAGRIRNGEFSLALARQ